MVLKQGENSKESKLLANQIKDLTKDINSNKEKLNAAENALSKVTAEAQKSRAPLDKLNDELKEQDKKLSELQTQYKNVVLEQGKNSSKAEELASKIKALNNDIKENKDKLNAVEKATDDLINTMKNGEKATEDNSKSLKEFGNSADNAGQKTLKMGDIIKANLISDTIKSGLSSLVSGIKSVANAIGDVILKPGFDRAMNIEQAQFKLKGLGHDAESVDSIMENALASVKGTAYGLDEAATVAASAVAAGVKPGKDLERTLKLVADSSAIAGIRMDEMGSIFNKIATARKISAKEINQLNQRGIPIAQLLAETMDKPVEKIPELVKDGEVGFAQFQAAIEKGMSGAALTMGQTFEGASANVKAAFSRLGASVLTPFTTALTPALGVCITLIDDIASGTTENIEENTAKLGEMLSNAVTTLISGLGPMLENLIKVISTIIPELAKSLPDISTTVVGFITNLVNVISTMAPQLATAAVQIIMGLVNALTNSGPQLATAAVQIIMGLVEALTNSGPQLATAAVEIITSLVTALIDALPQLLVAAIQIIVALAQGLTSAIPTLVPAIVDAVILMATTLLDNLDLIIKAGIDLLMALVQCIGPTINALVKKLPEIITSIVNCLVENIPILLAGAIELFMALVDAIPQIVVCLGENLPQIITAIVVGLARLPELIWNILVQCIGKFVNWGEESEEEGEEGSENFLEKVSTIIQELPGKLWEWLCEAITKVGEFFGNMIETGKTKAGEFLEKVVDTIKELPGKIWKWLCDTVQKVIEWGGDMVEKAKKAAQDTFDKIVDKIKEIPGEMLEIGKNIVEGIWDGIKNATDWIVGKVKEFAGKVVDGIKSFLGIESPSKVFRDQVGKNLALGLGEGFTQEMKDVSKQMEKAIPTNFDTDLNTAVNLATANSSLPIEINRRSVEELRLKNEVKDKKNEELLNEILNTARGINESLYGKFVSALVDGVSVSVNDREVARLVRRYA